MTKNNSDPCEKKSPSHKHLLYERVIQYFHDYSSVMVVRTDRIPSDRMQQIRFILRGRAEMLMGKNSVIKRAMRDLANSELERMEVLLKLCGYVEGNVALVFTNLTDSEELIKEIEKFKYGYKAQVGDVATDDVCLQRATGTGLEPRYISNFHEWNIPTKIVKGQIEILPNSLILKAGERIGKFKAELLEKLNLKPIEYGLTVAICYQNGDITWNRAYAKMQFTLNLKETVQEAMDNIACIGLDLDIPNVATIRHSLYGGLLNICRVMIDLKTSHSVSQFTINQLPSEILMLIGSFMKLSELNGFAKSCQSLLKLFFNRVVYPKSQGVISVPIEESLHYTITYVNEESKMFERVQLEIWKPLVRYYFPNFKGNQLNIKNWIHVLRRRIAYLKLKNPTLNISMTSNQPVNIREYEWDFLNSCEWVYKCPLKYESLRYHTDSCRKCDVCNKIVFHVKDEEEAKKHIVKGHCIAFVKPIEEEDDFEFMGYCISEW